MKRLSGVASAIILALVLTGLFSSSKADTSGCRTCGQVVPGSKQEVIIEYRDATTRSACGLRCAAAMLAAYRDKYVKIIRVRQYGSGRLIDAKKAFWVTEDGSMEAFSGKAEAVAFSTARGGRVVDFRAMMAALFSGMYDRVRTGSLLTGGEIGDDIKAHPKCDYCGMDRRKYAYSRVLLKYSDGSEAGLCSVHCAGLDLALHPEKEPVRILVGTYDGGRLVDAGTAVWVLGGTKHGVMSIRGKWAFEKKEDAWVYIRGFGGSVTDFRNIMRAAFEDMWEIIR